MWKDIVFFDSHLVQPIFIFFLSLPSFFDFFLISIPCFKSAPASIECRITLERISDVIITHNREYKFLMPFEGV